MAELRWGAATHPGQIRPQNEDNLLATDGVFVVADGMGGHEAGEVASQIAVERISPTLDGDDAARRRHVVESITDANTATSSAPRSPNPGQAGMGTTVTAIAVIGDQLAGRGAPNIDVNDDDRGEVTPIRPRRAVRGARARQRRRLAHLPVPPQAPAPRHRRPQLRPGARRHRPHLRGRGPHPPAPQHHHPRPRHRARREGRLVDAAADPRRPLPALQRRARRRRRRRRHRVAP